jgi:hypothetical protein
MVDLRRFGRFSEASSIGSVFARLAQYRSLIAEPLYFTLLDVACALRFSSCRAVAVSPDFGNTVVPEPSVNVSRTGTRRRLRSRSGVFPQVEKLNPFFQLFLGKSPHFFWKHLENWGRPPATGEDGGGGMWGFPCARARAYKGVGLYRPPSSPSSPFRARRFVKWVKKSAAR